MLCVCGAHQNATLLAEADADELAVADLTAQAKKSSGVMATLLRARRDQIQAEIRAEREFERALDRAVSSLLDTIEATVQSAGPDAIFNATDEQLLELLITGGLGDAIDGFITQQQRINNAVSKTLSAVDPEFNMGLIASDVEALQTQTISDIFEGVVIPTIKSTVRDGLRDLSASVPLNTVMSNLQTRMSRAQGRQLTDIKTKISQYGRSLTATASAVAGLNHYLYTGPVDGITRPFCRALVNLVVDEKQMRRLNNGQGLAVKTSGGGYNCRHSWSPVTESFIEAAELDQATASDISKANSRAKR